MSQWLLKTRPEYYKRRYGGFEFGVRSPLADLDFNYLTDIFSTLDKATNLGESRLNFFEKEVVSARISQNISYLVFSEALLIHISGTELKDYEKNNFDNVRVWFNNKGWAASVAYMNAVNNIILRAGVQQAGGCE